ncbi:MAG: repair protein RadA [Alphaproteobacteria bacterium]|nr:repair protein RadA [Alphaproteobacteria bacterium]
MPYIIFMSKKNTQYVCQACGTIHSKWAGQCTGCGEWNTLVEEVAEKPSPFAKGARTPTSKSTLEFVALSGHETPQPRRKSGISEFDRVCGGGLVPGCAMLIGGDPGIGKSTILLQVVADLSKSFHCAYISGEESIDQVRLRAERLGLSKATVELTAATNVNDIIATLKSGPQLYQVVVIDSIQTMYLDQLDSAPGTVAQVRACAAELIRVTKDLGICLFLVGHVTKEGMIAGPRVLEHMVDTVLYFEGERGHAFRILRAVKNRFGPTDEIGVFEMTDKGLAQVTNPSALFLAERSEPVSGSVVFAGIEGTRPVLVEIQALVAPSTFGTPRRAVIGWDTNRLAMVVAVLETRCGVQLGGRDIYLNVAGGLRVTEPAADLAVAAALLSAAFNVPFAGDAVVFGELALSGEIRAVAQSELRAKEAAKLGFAKIFRPRIRKAGKAKENEVLETITLGHLRDLLPFFGDRKKKKEEAE